MNIDDLITKPRDVRADAVALNFFGQTKTGKTTEVAKAFSDYLWIVTSPTILAPYYDWFATNRAEATAARNRVPVATIYLPERDPADPCKPFRQRQWMIDFLIQWSLDCRDGKAKFPGLVIDELSTYADRVWPEFLEAAGGRKGMHRAVAEYVEHFRFFCQIPRTPWGRDLITISHKADAKYDNDEDSPTRGKFRHPAGPKFAIGSVVRDVCQEFDGVIEAALDGVGDRSWITIGNDITYRGFRRFALDGVPIKDSEPFGFPSRIRKALDGAREKKARA